MIARDFNSGIGGLSDKVNRIDKILERKMIDKSINKHGNAFAEFLYDSKFSVLQGRITPEKDNDTSVSRKTRLW
jgi:hypothetical protein